MRVHVKSLPFRFMFVHMEGQDYQIRTTVPRPVGIGFRGGFGSWLLVGNSLFMFYRRQS